MRALGSALLELVAPSVCPGCDAPRAAGELLLCARCAAGVRRLPRLRAVHTAIAYEGIGLELVRRFKFDGRHDARAVLVAWLAARVRELPLRRDRAGAAPRRSRAQRIARSGPRARARPRRVRSARRSSAHVLWRARATPPQTGLTIAARRANVAGSFAARPLALAGRRVLLLDDVATTGATLVEAARTLRRESGAKRITLAAVAGTPASVL